jgi:transposase
VGQIARRYNQQGPDGVEDRRHQARGRAPTLTAEQQADLRQALEGPPPEGEQWTGRTVATWIASKLGRPVGAVP